MKHLKLISEMKGKQVKKYKDRSKKSLDVTDLHNDHHRPPDNGRTWNVAVRMSVPWSVREKIISKSEDIIDNFEPNEMYLVSVFKSMIMDNIGLESHWGDDFASTWLNDNGDNLPDFYSEYE